MSMYFFRLHNLRRAEEDKKRKKQIQDQQKRRRHRSSIYQRRYNNNQFSGSGLTLVPSRLFERPPLTPSDSLDEVALQIPRWPYVNIYN